MRSRTEKRMRLVERAADTVFIISLFLMAIVCALITYAVV